MKQIIQFIALFFVFKGAVATTGADLDFKIRELIADKGLTANPMADIDTPNIASKKAQLGMRLFYSKALSGDRDTACVSCHHPMLGGGDGLSLPIGTETVSHDLLGPGRLHDTMNSSDYVVGPTVPRNAPTTFNIAAWKKSLFHDGRIQRLEGKGISTPETEFGQVDPLAGDNLVNAQARFPVISAGEMKGFSYATMRDQPIRDFLAARIGAYGDDAPSPDSPKGRYWLEQFRDVYGAPEARAEELITEQTIFALIGEYERSQVFINSPWKAYVEGDDSALSDQEKQGAWLFFASREQGGADCASCHEGDLFSDEGFHNLAMPQIGRGKGDGKGHGDYGRYRESEDIADIHAFRTPTLLNVEVTGPWSHAGAYTSLDEVVWHHLNPQASVKGYQLKQLIQPNIQHLDTVQSRTQVAIDAANFEGLNLSLKFDQVSSLVVFLKSLTDPCVKDRACLAPWILEASDGAVDPNGDQLFARNSEDQEL